MTLKRVIFVALILYALVATVVLVFGFLDSDLNPANNDSDQTSIASQPAEQPTQQTTETNQQALEAAGDNNQPATEPTPACGEGGPCTAAEVAEHNQPSDCWVIYESKVYNVTSYTSTHPGGPGAFDTSTCGTDIIAQIQGQAGSDSLSKQHSHSSRDLRDLSNYFIADLAN